MTPPAALPPPTHDAHRRRIPRTAVLRFILLVVVAGAGFAALRWTPLAAWIADEALISRLRDLSRTGWAPAALVAAYALLCPLGVPATPLVLAGGVVFGVGWGSVWNVVGTFLGAVTSYLFGRSFGRELVSHLLGHRLVRVERLLARRGFWPLVRVRIMPIPFPLVNYAAALVGVPFPLYATSSFVGLAPAIVLFTYFVDRGFRAATGGGRGTVLGQAVAAFALLLVLTYLPRWIDGRKRRRRHAELLAARRARARGGLRSGSGLESGPASAPPT